MTFLNLEDEKENNIEEAKIAYGDYISSDSDIAKKGETKDLATSGVLKYINICVVNVHIINVH